MSTAVQDAPASIEWIEVIMQSRICCDIEDCGRDARWRAHSRHQRDGATCSCVLLCEPHAEKDRAVVGSAGGPLSCVPHRRIVAVRWERI